MTAAELLAIAVSLALGYVFGSLPLVRLVGRMAGHVGSLSASGVWREAGPGWGLLALSVDLARGILPVTLALVTFSWVAGLAAGFGAVGGALWPAAGRLPADRSVALAIGVLIVLVPLAGMVAAVVGAVMWARSSSRSRA